MTELGHVEAIEKELMQIESSNAWNQVYQKVRSDGTYDFSLTEARSAINRPLNRYRDVLPYDHSRIILQHSSTDYINASLVKVESINRQYILTQGPLSQTSQHFWLMVWQQQCKGIIMLNKIIEKNMIKCHQYWPLGEKNGGENCLNFPTVGLKVDLVTEVKHHHYIYRTLRLTELSSNTSREVLHFHYTTWPDFGVPQSPEAFNKFLSIVIRSGCLDPDVGPAIVHCSAGIGRSGTFCLVDTLLVMLERGMCSSNVGTVLEVLLDMRRYRMGLIQTPDQLRFSYRAIVHAAASASMQPNGSLGSGYGNNNGSTSSICGSTEITSSITEENTPDLIQNSSNTTQNNLSSSSLSSSSGLTESLSESSQISLSLSADKSSISGSTDKTIFGSTDETISGSTAMTISGSIENSLSGSTQTSISLNTCNSHLIANTEHEQTSRGQPHQNPTSIHGPNIKVAHREANGTSAASSSSSSCEDLSDYVGGGGAPPPPPRVDSLHRSLAGSLLSGEGDTDEEEEDDEDEEAPHVLGNNISHDGVASRALPAVPPSPDGGISEPATPDGGPPPPVPRSALPRTPAGGEDAVPPPRPPPVEEDTPPPRPPPAMGAGAVQSPELLASRMASEVRRRRQQERQESLTSKVSAIKAKREAAEAWKQRKRWLLQPFLLGVLAVGVAGGWWAIRTWWW